MLNSVAPGRYAHVVGWGSAVPERVLTNAEIESFVETNDAWIRERTGICERRIASPDDDTVSLGTRAARRALACADILPNQVDLIITATSTPARFFPATANLIQDRLGATRAGAFDLLAACTGFIYGLGLAAAQIRTGAINTAVVIGTETLSRIVDWQDRNTCILFGDGAGAFVLTASEVPGGVLDVVLHSDGSGGDLLTCHTGMRSFWLEEEASRDAIHMSGREVFRFASRVMVTATEEVLERCGLEPEDVSLVVPHQANIRIIEAAARGLKLPMEQFAVNIERYGNTSTASIPLAFEEAMQAERVHSNDYVVLVGFGAGLTWGAAVIQWAARPTRAIQLRAILQESWYILARVRSLFLRFLRFIGALIFRKSDTER